MRPCAPLGETVFQRFTLCPDRGEHRRYAEGLCGEWKNTCRAADACRAKDDCGRWGQHPGNRAERTDRKEERLRR
ncbi:MAG TPA: hypothetical protein DEP61_06410 [Lachnospiraceae bacterium]|nr:hypothetical protein [Lachnospiraceae bacterium]